MADSDNLTNLLHELRFGNSIHAAAALETLGDRSAIPALLNTVRMGTYEEVTAAGGAIGRLARREDVPTLCNVLSFLVPLSLIDYGLFHNNYDSEDTFGRQSAARQYARLEVMTALSRFADPRAVLPLLACRKPPVSLVELLVKFGTPAIPDLLSALEAPADLDVEAALGALIALGEPAVRPLREAFARVGPEDQWRFAVALACLGAAGDEMVSFLVQGLHDKDAAETAAKALSRVAETSTGPALRSALPDLHHVAGGWLTPHPTKEACRGAIRRIEESTAAVRSMPLPAEAPDALPRSAGPVEPDAAQLPVVKK